MSRTQSINRTIATDTQENLGAGKRSGFLNTLAKRAVTRRLDALTQGVIGLQDDSGQSVHGSDASGRGATIRVHNPDFYRESILGGGLGFAESYLDGLWETPDLTELLRIFVRDISVAHNTDRGLARLRNPLLRIGSYMRRNTRDGSRRNIAAHYDLGNEFFSLFLDETMTYSSGIFYSPENTLQEASVNKLDRICRKLQLNPGDHVLETGTGWGSFAIHAATNYGCRVTTTTISAQQHEVAKQRIEAAGLTDRVTLLLEDYRNLQGSYDKLVSIEMIEAVGHAYLKTYLGACSDLLNPDGQMLLQVISMPNQRYQSYLRTTDFIQKHVFPGSCCPSLNAVSDAITNATDMRCVQYEDITPHYAQTLELWRQRFEARLEEVKALGYPPEFIRMWRYYLSYCIAGFAERYIGVGQMLINKPGCRDAVHLPPIERPNATSGSKE
jgi:cyclopropane-fatty-acyl-phospholipid synthase